MKTGGFRAWGELAWGKLAWGKLAWGKLAWPAAPRCGAGILLAGLLSAQALAQTAPREDFLIRPPQVPQVPQVPGQGGQPMPPPGAPGASPGVDLLVRQGFEVKAVSRTSDKATDYLLVLQRSGELRTCLLRLSRDANRALKRDSVCF